MTKNKKFDCVRMKWDIQRQILKEFSHLSDEEAHKVQMTNVAQNSILGPFYKKLRSVKRTSTK